MMTTLIVGGAGFIGSHITDALLSDSDNSVRIFDNFSSGRKWHFEHHLDNSNFEVVSGEAEDTDLLTDVAANCDRLIHLASNPDIAKAVSDPSIDFWQGTVLTNSVAEAARRANVREVLYASGSGIYGDLGNLEVHEGHGPLIPTSPYGASKLAGEALLSAYSSMFDINVTCFRFGNVVGARQTHGVGYDFARRLRRDSSELRVLGDGTQSKPYVHVSDVVRAVLSLGKTRKTRFEAFNIAPEDAIDVTTIARLAMEALGVETTACKLNYPGGSRGWKGDVPIVRLNTSLARERGWAPHFTSAEAMWASLLSIIEDDELGRFAGSQ